MLQATLPRVIRSGKWVVVQHVAHEGPGLIAAIAAGHELELEVCRCYEGQPLPHAGELAGLVLMGGPMGVGEASRYPFLAGELDLITEALANQTPLLGVCLGAQLLAAALGGAVYRGEREEIGPGWVSLTADGLSDPVLGCLGLPEIPVFHWHGETFDLPYGARLLAGSELFPHQAFVFGRCAYGLQFHIEVDATLASIWREHLPASVELGESHLQEIGRRGEAILDAFFAQAIA
jgi:GMP synthase (glutamine-hydrolysing)